MCVQPDQGENVFLHAHKCVGVVLPARLMLLLASRRKRPAGAPSKLGSGASCNRMLWGSALPQYGLGLKRSFMRASALEVRKLVSPRIYVCEK